jgi:histidinol-phosphate aminotransferase
MREGNRYPRTKVAEFKALVAKDAGVTPEHVIVGAGSIELMLSAGLYYGKRGKTVVAADPTWHTTAEYAEANGAKWVKVPLTPNYKYDFKRMLEAVNDDVDLVYICHPNNPTGVAEDQETLKRFVLEVAGRTRVMVDEAFIDCLDNSEQISLKSLVPTHKNVVIARTFSKLWGMAGFRVGYMIGDPAYLAELKETIPRLEMQSRLSVAAAIAAYNDRAFIESSREQMRTTRTMIYAILNKRGIEHIRSDSNFVTFEVNEDAEQAREKLLARGVALKNVTFGGKQRLRVSCGSIAEIRMFEKALDSIV